MPILKDSEAKIEAWVVRQAWDQLGVPSIKLNVKGDTGWPDRLFLLPGGRTLWIEFKSPGNDLEPRQKLKRDILKIRAHDHQVHSDRHEAFVAIGTALMESTRLSAEGG